jgi:spermidine synthase
VIQGKTLSFDRLRTGFDLRVTCTDHVGAPYNASTSITHRPFHTPMLASKPVAVLRRPVLLALAAAAFASFTIDRARAAEPALENFAGRLEYDGAGMFSHIRIRRSGDLRSMLFVRDTGEEVIESRVDLKRPQVLQFEYLKHLFTSYLFADPQADVLIIGLGGGGMIHFLRREDPGVAIDAVEIDPVVVKLADEFFGVRTGEKVNIITADGLKFIAENEKQYDVIYMDAFLKPSAETDSTGVPLALRTRQFYEQLQTRLKPGGVVAFNLNPHPQMREDIRAIAEAFPQAYEFSLPRFQGSVVVATMAADRVPRTELIKRARALDKRFHGLLSFTEMARRVRE